MKLIKLENAPKEYYGGSKETDALSGYEIKKLEEKGIEEAYYWYVSGCYEGSGYILYKKESKWYIHGMGHCSCYGPLEDLNFSKPYNSLDGVLFESTKDYISYVVPLIELARERGA